MFKTGSLLLVSILAVALVAPPARSQSQKLTLEDVTRDVLFLQNYVKEMQRSFDTKNAEMKATLDQMTARFSSIDATLQKLGSSLDAIKTTDEKSYQELQAAKLSVNSLKDNLEKLELGQTLLDIKNGMRGLRDDVRNIQVTESSGPTVRQAYDSAYGLFNQGFYDDAISEFRELVRAYPRETRAAKAQLHIGMAYFQLKKFDQALVAYDETLQTYPESDVKCSALYKKGQTLVELKNTAEAGKVFQSVVKECPGTDEAPLAAADLKKLPAAARGRGAK